MDAVKAKDTVSATVLRERMYPRRLRFPDTIRRTAIFLLEIDHHTCLSTSRSRYWFYYMWKSNFRVYLEESPASSLQFHHTSGISPSLGADVVFLVSSSYHFSFYHFSSKGDLRMPPKWAQIFE